MRLSLIPGSVAARASCLALVAVLLAGCDEEGTPTAPASPPPAAPVPPALLRIAHLTADARTIDVAVNGNFVFYGLDYPEVSDYATLEPGTQRIQFVETALGFPAIAETTLGLAAGQAITVAVVGFDTQAFVIRDDRTTSAQRSRVRFVNAVPDFPSPLDLAIVNGPVLIGNSRYLEPSGYVELIPGRYDFELRRAGTRETSAELLGQILSSGATYTVFAIGSLLREDIELHLAHDAG